MHDVTLSGGEPFEQPKACAALAAELKRNGYGVWSYSGYLYEDLAKRADKARAERDRRIGALGGKALHENPEEAMVSEALADIADDLAVGDLLDSIDVLVDGPLREVAQVPRAEVVRLLQPASDRCASHPTHRLYRGMAAHLVFAREALQLVGEHLWSHDRQKFSRFW